MYFLQQPSLSELVPEFSFFACRQDIDVENSSEHLYAKLTKRLRV